MTRSIVLVTAVATLYELACVTKRDFDWNSFVLVTINSSSHKNNCNTEQYVTILRYSVSTDDYFEVMWSGFGNPDKINRPEKINRVLCLWEGIITWLMN